jgi:hypothetical protein
MSNGQKNQRDKAKNRHKYRKMAAAGKAHQKQPDSSDEDDPDFQHGATVTSQFAYVRTA